MKLTVELLGEKLVSSRIGKMLTDHPKLAGQAMYTAALKVLIPAIRANIRTDKTVFTGAWFSRQNASVMVLADKIELSVGAFGVPYGLDLELGSPPSSQSESKLVTWLMKKNGFNAAMAAKYAKTLKRHIELKGTKAHPAIKPAWDANTGAFLRDAIARLKAALARGTP